MAKKLIKGTYQHRRKSLKNSSFSNIKLEKRFLGGIIKYPDVARSILSQINAEVFSSDKTKWVHEHILEIYTKTGFIIDDKSFKELLNTLRIRKRKIYNRLWKSIRNSGEDVSEASLFLIRDELEALYQARLMIYNAELTADTLSKVKIDGYKKVKEAIDQYSSIQSELIVERMPVIVIDPIESFEDFKKFHKKAQANPKQFKGVPTGIKPMDKRMGGLRDAEFAIMVTVTGTGKSIFLLDVATHCYQNYGDVIYVTIEMPELQMRQRLYCRLSRIKYKFFRNFELKDQHWRKLDKKVYKKFENHPYKFHIIDMPGSGTVKMVKNKVEDILNRNPNVRLICVDYMNIMRCSSGTLAVDWQNQIEIAVDIKQSLARYFNIGTWSAAQLTAKTEGRQGPIHIRDMALARNIVDHIDVGAYLTTTDATEEDNIFRIGFIKTRDFSAKEFYLKGDRDRMTFSNVKKKDRKKFDAKQASNFEI